MRKRKRALRPLDHSYSEQQLTGLRTHTQEQKQNTVERQRTAITSLKAQHKPISARTIYEECGLTYASFRRSPETLLLYQQHSTFLKRERKRARTACPDTPSPRDPLLAYKKPDLVAPPSASTGSLFRTRDTIHGYPCRLRSKGCENCRVGGRTSSLS
jgi:hypothetical protein